MPSCALIIVDVQNATLKRTSPAFSPPGVSANCPSTTCATTPASRTPRTAPANLEIAKQTNSAFVGNDFERRLRSAGHTTLFIAGVITNNSVEATVRAAGNLGFETYLVEDACFTFARLDWHGRLRTADEVHAMSVANMSEEYATILTTREAIARSGHNPTTG